MAKPFVDDVEIKENARKEELKAYFIFNKHLFSDKHVVIGDDIPNHEPDIFSDDHKIGLEVVMCEFQDAYNNNLQNAGTLKYNYNDFGTDKKLTGCEKSYLAKLQKCRDDGLKNFLISRECKYDEEQINEFYTELYEALTNKLERLNEGAYDSCDQINLVVMSNLLHKSFIDEEKIDLVYESAKKDFARHFDNAYIVCNSEIYNLETKSFVDPLSKNDDKFKIYQSGRRPENLLNV